MDMMDSYCVYYLLVLSIDMTEMIAVLAVSIEPSFGLQ